MGLPLSRDANFEFFIVPINSNQKHLCVKELDVVSCGTVRKRNITTLVKQKHD